MVRVTSCVIDASVTASWILPDEASSAVEALFEKVFSGEIKLIAPSLWSWECINFVGNAIRRGRITKQAASQTVWALSGLPVELVPLNPADYFTLFDVSTRYTLTAYDAAYFYLAQKIGATLITLDTDLLKLRPEFPFIITPAELGLAFEG